MKLFVKVWSPLDELTLSILPRMWLRWSARSVKSLGNRMLPLIHACDKVFTSFFNSLFVLDFEGKVHSGRDESEMQRHQARARVEHPAVQRECKAFKDS